MTETGIRAGLAGVETFRVLLYDETDSTNRQAGLLWDEACAAGKLPPVTLLAARAQTAGRGRLGRSFFSPPDNGLYMTLLCPVDITPDKAAGITAAAAVCTCRAVESLTELKPGIKWVNDLYLSDCKVCGILCAYLSPRAPGMPGGLAVGIGLNLTTRAFPDGLRAPAASLADFAPEGLTLDAGLLCGRIAGSLASLIRADASASGLFSADTLAAYRARLLWVGREVECTRGNESFRGIVRGVDDGYRLTVETGGGIRLLDSGEISVRTVRAEDTLT